MLKKLLAMLLTAVMAFQFAALYVFADENANGIHIFFNDKEIEFKYKPEIKNDTLMCELQGFCDALGITYDYNGDTKNVNMVYRSKYSIDAVLGADTVIADECTVDVDEKFYAKGNRIMMPLDSVCYIYNINIDKSDLSHIKVEEKPVAQKENYQKKMDEALENLDAEHTVVFEGTKFLENSSRQNPSYYETKMVDVEGQSFDKALNIKATSVPDVFYATQITLNCDKPIKPGNLLVISFWGRSIFAKNDSGYARSSFNLEMNKSPWDKILMGETFFTNEWQKYYFYIVTGLTYDANNYQLCYRWGYNIQELEVADFRYDIYSNESGIYDLPEPEPEYKGVEDDAIWRKEAYKRIEKYRKNDMVINVTDENGNPVENAEVNAKMTDSEMLWGGLMWGTDFAKNYNTATGYSPETEKKLELYKENGFNMLVCGNENKPSGIIYGAKDLSEVINWCIDNNFKYRAHAYIWEPFSNDMKGLFLPFWNGVDSSRENTEPKTYRQRMEEQINMMATFLQDVAVETDVANEVTSRHAGMFTSLGLDEFVRIYKICKQINPSSKLLWTETAFGGMPPTSGQRPTVPIVAKYFKEAGANVDGIGIQGHRTIAEYPYYFYENAESVADYTDYIAITEYDQLLQYNNLKYPYFRDVLLACYSHPKIKSFTIWTPYYVPSTTSRGEVLYGKDFEPLPGLQAWKELVMGEWRTNETATTDSNGTVKIRGHRGKYDVMVKVGDKTNVITVNLTENEEKNVINAVVKGDTVELSCENVYVPEAKKDYVNANDIGKMTELDWPEIDGSPKAKTTIDSCVDQSGKEIQQVFDGDDSTVWTSRDENDFLTLTLRDDIDLKKIIIKWDNGFVKRFDSKIELSSDGESWTTVREGINPSVDDEIDLTGKKAKYIRISTVKNIFSIRDIKLYVK